MKKIKFKHLHKMKIGKTIQCLKLPLEKTLKNFSVFPTN